MGSIVLRLLSSYYPSPTIFATTGEVCAEGVVLHAGKSQAVVESRLLDADAGSMRSH